MEGRYTQIPTAFDPLHIESFVWNRKMSENFAPLGLAHES